MISIQNLSFKYNRKKPLFENMNLELESGSIYGLLGKNGAGKSTLLYNITGLVFPQKGEINVLGFKPQNRKPSFLSNVYFLPEEPVFPSISIPQFLKLNAPFYPNFNVHQFYDFLKELDVEASSKLNDFSFGQQKKVMIAFGLACNTRLLIMDEPTNGLDIPSKSKFRKLVAASISDERLFIISTHQVRDLESLIDQVIIMNDSKVVLKASTEEIGQKLSFKTLDNPQEEVLYAEESILGRVGVVLNMEEQESKINLEHLFGAVMNKGSLVREIFSK
jgi:ABC-2 type transport system ATP-binding protein